MSSFWQRFATVALGVATMAAAGLLPSAAMYLFPAGLSLVTWAIPHTADVSK